MALSCACTHLSIAARQARLVAHPARTPARLHRNPALHAPPHIPAAVGGHWPDLRGGGAHPVGVDRAALRVRGRSLDCEEAEELPSLHRRMWASVSMFMMVSVQLPPHAPV